MSIIQKCRRFKQDYAYNYEREVSKMKGRLFEWIIAPLLLLAVAIYQTIAAWDESRVVAIFFILGGIAATWLLVYGTSRFLVVRRYKKKQAQK